MKRHPINRWRPAYKILTLFWSLAWAGNLAMAETLPKIKLAPEFTLTRQDGKRLSLKDLRGKVLAITFIYASCTDTCPLLTAKMTGIQDRLGPAFGPEVNFLSITVDPEHDTPARLAEYAKRFHATSGWRLYTGTAEASQFLSMRGMISCMLSQTKFSLEVRRTVFLTFALALSRRYRRSRCREPASLQGTCERRLSSRRSVRPSRSSSC